jgi:hypothetical protein
LREKAESTVRMNEDLKELNNNLKSDRDII